MNQERIDELDAAIQAVPEEWRYRWCGPDKDEPIQDWHACACMGAVNCSGRLGHRFTRAEWREWVAQHPPKIESAAKFIDANGRFDLSAHEDFVYSVTKRRFEKDIKKAMKEYQQ